MGAGGCRTEDMLARGVGVAEPESVPRGSVEAWLRGVGSMTFVRLGSGDEGRDGGSWVGRGVSDIAACARIEARDVVSRGGEQVMGLGRVFWWGRWRRVQERLSLAGWRASLFPPWSSFSSFSSCLFLHVFVSPSS